jgi:hypothetical protein
MKRLLNPELALGFLIATLLWIGVLGWQAQKAVRGSQGELFAAPWGEEKSSTPKHSYWDGDQKQQQPERAVSENVRRLFALVVPGKCGRDDRQVLFDLLPVALFFSVTEFRVGSG